MHVVIPTSGRLRLLERTLRSLEQCRKPREFQGVVVVENGAAEGVEELGRRYSRWMPVSYVWVPTANKSNALNVALERFGDEQLIVFFDDDVRLDEQVLIAYADAAGRRGNAFFGGPFRVDYEGSPPPSWLLRFLPGSAQGWNPADPGCVKSVIGFNWAARVADIRRAGGFSPEFGPGSPSGMRGQETEMQMRLRKMGCAAVFVRDASVWHYVPQERCSPQWALERAFGNAMNVGYQAARRGRPQSGVPLAMRIDAVARGLRRRMLSPFTFSARKRFRWRFREAWTGGLVAGYRLAIQRPVSVPRSGPRPDGGWTRDHTTTHINRRGRQAA